MKLKEIARILGAELRGDGEIEIIGVSSLEDAREGEIAPYYRKTYEKLALSSRASAFLVGPNTLLEGRALLICENPRATLIKLIKIFHPQGTGKKGISPTAAISPTARLGRDVFVGDFVKIGENVVIGDGVEIHAGTVIYENVKIGANTKIYANVVIREGTEIGKRCIIHPGVVIGCDGFGFEAGEKIPQVGRVIIGDDVEIGGGTVIDRAALGTTKIGNRVKIGNLCLIAHGTKIGDDSMFAGMIAIGGSARIGRGVICGGMAGIRDNLEVGDGAMIAAMTCVFRKVAPGEVVGGCPNTDIKTWKMAMARLYRLGKKGKDKD